PFDGNARDMSGNAYDGVVIGPRLTRDRFGHPNSAYRFEMGNHITTNYPGIMGGKARTVSGWIRTNNTGTMYLLSWGGDPDGPGNSFRCRFGWEKSQGVAIDVSNGMILHEAVVADQKWHHYAWVVPAYTTIDKILIYRDGVLTKPIIHYKDEEWSRHTLVVTQSGSNLVIGRYQEADYFLGDMDDIRVFDRALSEQEVLTLYHEGGWPKTPVGGGSEPRSSQTQSPHKSDAP